MKTYKRKRFVNTRDDLNINELREVRQKMVEGGVPLDKVKDEAYDYLNPGAAAKRRWDTFKDYPGNTMFARFEDPSTGLPAEGNNYWYKLLSHVVHGTEMPDVEDYMAKLPAVGDLRGAIEGQRAEDMLSSDSEARQIEANMGPEDDKSYATWSEAYARAEQRGDEQGMRAAEQGIMGTFRGQWEAKRQRFRGSDQSNRFYGMGF